jgi:hypothetical protein
MKNVGVTFTPLVAPLRNQDALFRVARVPMSDFQGREPVPRGPGAEPRVDAARGAFEAAGPK